MNRVVVYSKQGCPFCSLLKLELGKRRITYDEFDLSDDNVRKAFYAASGANTVPQVYVTDVECGVDSPSGTSLGGYESVSTSWNTLIKMLA